MSRTPVGLVNPLAPNFNWQLSVAHGCLISGPSCRALPAGLVRASKSGLAEPVVRAGIGEIHRNSRFKCLSFGVWKGEKTLKRLNM